MHFSKLKISFLFLLFFLAITLNLRAEEKLPYIAPPSPETDAQSYVLMDADSHQILAQKAADEIRFPASLTKIMTAFVAFNEIEAGNISLDDEVFISENAWKTGGSRSFIKVHTKMRMEDLLKAMIVQSGNDSAVAIAEHIAGDEATFAQLMNLYAKKIGLTNTSFANSSGLPHEKEYTTAKDMATLCALTISQFPNYYKWYSIKELEINGIKQYNRNKLLWKDNEVDGMKTGYTEEASYNLVASAVRDDMRLIAVVMKAQSPSKRETDAYKLLNFGFRFFKTKRAFEANSLIHSAKVEGFETEIPIGIKKSVFITAAQNREELLDYQYQLKPDLIAPVEKDEQIGELVITFNNEVIKREAIFALEDVNKASIMGAISNWFKSIF